MQPSSTVLSMCHSARLYHCQRCHAQVIICSSCDRGQRYCAGSCSADAREAARKRASKKYQSTPAGKHKNAARQSRFRARQKEKVTHHGSLPEASHGVLRTRLHLLKGSPKSHGSDKGLCCHHCGETCGEYLRHDFLRSRRVGWVLRRSQ